MYSNIKIDDLVEILIERGLISEQDLENLHSSKKEVPVSIFCTELSPLESLVRYLKENLGFSIKDMVQLTGKNSSAISLAYKNSLTKKFTFSKNTLKIPIDEFSAQLSVLEIVVRFLQKTMKNSEIAILLNRDQRTIWTIASRAKKKVIHEV